MFFIFDTKNWKSNHKKTNKIKQKTSKNMKKQAYSIDSIVIIGLFLQPQRHRLTAIDCHPLSLRPSNFRIEKLFIFAVFLLFITLFSLSNFIFFVFEEEVVFKVVSNISSNSPRKWSNCTKENKKKQRKKKKNA